MSVTQSFSGWKFLVKLAIAFPVLLAAFVLGEWTVPSAYGQTMFSDITGVVSGSQ